MSPTQSATIQGNIVSRNGRGVATIAAVYRHRLRWGIHTETIVGFGTNHFARLKVTKAFADSTYAGPQARPKSSEGGGGRPGGSLMHPRGRAAGALARCAVAASRSVAVTGNAVAVEDGIGLAVNTTVSRPLSRTLGGFVTHDWGAESALGVGVTHGGPKYAVRSSLQLTPQSVGMEAQGTYKLSDRSKVRARADVSTSGVSVAFGIERAVSKLSQLTTMLEVGSRAGIVVRLKCVAGPVYMACALDCADTQLMAGSPRAATRGGCVSRYARLGQTFVLPIVLDTEPSWHALAVGVLVPAFAGYLVKKFVLDPREQRQRQLYGAR